MKSCFCQGHLGFRRGRLRFFEDIDLQSQLLGSRREQEPLQAPLTFLQGVGNGIDEGAVQLIYCFKDTFRQLCTDICSG